jgi:hypothetical protein
VFRRHAYHCVTGTATIDGARIPFVVESWAKTERAEGSERDSRVAMELWVNRSPSLARLYGSSGSSLVVRGCTLSVVVRSAKKAHYEIILSLITPYLKLTSDGKSPLLLDFHAACSTAISKATSAAYRAMVRPPRQMSIKDAAWLVMADAYREVADNRGGRPLPANARQIMYKARPKILALTGGRPFTDHYFTQVLLPDFIAEHPELCAAWDVVYDARGNLIEPHTGYIVPLGTLPVRQYLGERPEPEPVAQFPINVMYPTRGAQHRYRNLLYIEKEGFEALIAASRLRERFDIAFMSCKGMSVIAARQMIDGLIRLGLIDRVFILHDFDVSGFSIAGTLTGDSRRYTYENPVEVVDLGLVLDDVLAEGLDSEPVEIDRDHDAVAATLRRHGVAEDGIDFLLGRDDDGTTKRVELNAMGSRQLIDFTEAKLVEHGVEKLVPDDAVIEEHARRLIEQKLIQDGIEARRSLTTALARRTKLPDDLEDQVHRELAAQPELSWDQAVAVVLDID